MVLSYRVRTEEEDGTEMGKLIVIAALIAILYNLGAGLVYMMIDRGGTSRTVNALTWRVGLSVGLILIVMFSVWMGWIKPHGLYG